MATTVWPGSTRTADRSAAVASAPAGSAMMPSVWYMSSISLQTAPSATVTTSMSAEAITPYGASPMRLTAAPSTNVSTLSSSTGCPTASAAWRLAAPAGSTPTIRVCGARSRNQVTTPARSPPPPTGTTSTSGALPRASTISAHTVPWPAMVSGWSKAWTITAPVLAAYSAAAAAASSYVSPLTTSSTASPPIATMRSRFWRGVVDGTKMRPRMPSRWHAKATPWPWLPADAQTTPVARSSSVSWAIRLYAPRSLYDRTGCRSSRFTHTSAPVTADKRTFSCSGVRCTIPSSRADAASTSAAVGIRVMSSDTSRETRRRGAGRKLSQHLGGRLGSPQQLDLRGRQRAQLTTQHRRHLRGVLDELGRGDLSHGLLDRLHLVEHLVGHLQVAELPRGSHHAGLHRTHRLVVRLDARREAASDPVEVMSHRGQPPVQLLAQRGDLLGRGRQCGVPPAVRHRAEHRDERRRGRDDDVLPCRVLGEAGHLLERLRVQGLARHEQHHELRRRLVGLPVLLGAQGIGVASDVLGEHLQAALPLRRLRCLLRVEERAERHLGIHVHELALGEHHLHVGPDHAVIGRRGLLLHEVAVLDHAGQLDDPLELQLAPRPTYLRLAKRRRQGVRLTPHLVAGQLHRTNLLSQLRGDGHPLLLDLGQSRLEPVQAHLHRRHDLLSRLEPLLGGCVGHLALPIEHLARQHLELHQQRLAVGGELLGALHRRGALGLRLRDQGLEGRQPRLDLSDLLPCLGDVTTRLGDDRLRPSLSRADLRRFSTRSRGVGPSPFRLGPQRRLSLTHDRGRAGPQHQPRARGAQQQPDQEGGDDRDDVHGDDPAGALGHFSHRHPPEAVCRAPGSAEWPPWLPTSTTSPRSSPPHPRRTTPLPRSPPGSTPPRTPRSSRPTAGHSATVSTWCATAPSSPGGCPTVGGPTTAYASSDPTPTLRRSGSSRTLCSRRRAGSSWA